MASSLIHLAIAKGLEEKLNIKNRKDYYLGSIAPDISKHIGESKTRSHFLYTGKDDVPDLDHFKKEYPNFMNGDFNLGYYIHLYGDKLWFDGFIDKLIDENNIKLLDGTIVKTTSDEMLKYIYNDYTNLNITLIDKYNMDLSLFYEDFSVPDTDIVEIPIEKLNLLIDQAGIIIENTTKKKSYVFDAKSIFKFIDNAVEIIYNDLMNK